MYCKHCGNKVAMGATVCMKCGVRVGEGNTYCPSCGAKPDPLAAICIKCGYELKKQNVIVDFFKNDKKKIDNTTFLGAIKSCLKKYVNFKERSCRAEFWWWTLFATIVEILAVIPFVGWLLFAPIWLLTIVPTIAVTVRRLHDIGKAWPFIFMYLIPVAGIVLWIMWGVQESEPRTNEYGPVPSKS